MKPEVIRLPRLPERSPPCLQRSPPPGASAAPAKAVKLPPLAPRPGYIIGRAVFADGRPVPKFQATALGWAGEIHLGPSGTIPSLGSDAGQNGSYAIRSTSAFDRTKPIRATVVAVQARAAITYNGREYGIEMHPLDGKPDGSAPGAFRGDTARGVVRDFVLKIHGPKRGYEQNTPPRDTPTNELSDRSFGAFYGGSVTLDMDRSLTSEKERLAGTTITLTFTPVGPLMDGTTGKALVRTVPILTASSVGSYHYLRDLPLGDYTVAATVTQEGGGSMPLRLRVLGGEWGSSAPVIFHPLGSSLTSAASVFVSR